MNKLIPKKQTEITVGPDSTATSKVDKKIQDNINKLNKKTPKKLSGKDDSNRPLAPGGSNRNIRGVIRTANHGLKFK